MAEQATANQMMVEGWMSRLKTAYDAGYYKTESDEGKQTAFPWQDKTCQDCPFFSSNICQVHAEYRAPKTHTCAYFDTANREEAQNIIQQRQWQGFRRWWEWFDGKDLAQ